MCTFSPPCMFLANVSGIQDVTLLNRESNWDRDLIFFVCTYLLLSTTELAQISGIAAILRFPLPDIGDEEEEENNDEDGEDAQDSYLDLKNNIPEDDDEEDK